MIRISPKSNEYIYYGVNNWTPNDICYNGIPLVQADIDPAEDVKSLDQSIEYKEWRVPGMVQEWANGGSLNYGLGFRCQFRELSFFSGL